MAVSQSWRRQLLVGVLLATAVSAGAVAARPDVRPSSPVTPSLDPAAGQRGGGGGGVPQSQPVAPLRFRYMGPAPAGRVAAAVGVPGDSTTYYLGSASGGVWKSTDGGESFIPVFDDQPVAAIGALAVAPSDPAQVWAGTGEAWVIRDSDIMGDGVYKSTDAGATWKNMGLGETGRIGRVIVHPTNPNIVFVCAIGRVTGPQPDRGVFRTTDGGATWQRVLFVNADTGCSGLSMDANDPNTLVAGTWQVVLHTWGEFSGMWPGYTGTPGSGVYISHDGGTKWAKVDVGMPRPPVGKIDVAIAPSNSKRIYALIQTADQGSLWRSEDGGATFKVVSWDRTLIGRAGYYIRLAVNPTNPDDVFVLNSGYHRSADGGATFSGGGGGGGAGCGDCHDVWIDPRNAARVVLTDDGGAQISTGQGSVIRVSLPNGQMYHVATDNRVPYWIYSNRQDDGTMRGPSTTPEQTGRGCLPEPPGAALAPAPPAGRAGRGGGGAAGRGAAVAAPSPCGSTTGAVGPAAGGGRGGGRGGTLAWQPGIGGCESGFTLPDLNDPDIVWASCYGNEVTRFDNRLGRARSVSPWIHTLDSEPNKAKYRCHWTPPLAIDPFDTKTVYYGCQVIFKTSDGGQNWSVISPDLSTQDPTRIVSSGGIVGDNLGQFYGELVFAIAPSKIQRGLIWAGTNDGKLWNTRDGGGHWTDVTKNVTGLPAWGTISQIDPSNFAAGTAYVAVDAHLNDDRKPYLFKTADFGQTWTRLSDTLPQGHPLDYVKSVAENPNKAGMVFAGTGHGFFYSMDDGAHWTRFKDGLPPAPVTWITIQKPAHDVVISTYGRGLFILPDITILEQTGQPMPPPVTRLFTPKPAFRMARSGQAEFLFSLASASPEPVRVEVLDGNGQLVRQLDVQGARAGLNRAEWDLRYEAPRTVALRTTPKENPEIWQETRFRGRDTRPVVHWGIGGTQTTGPIAAPGKYSVRLTVAGQTFTEPFDVLKDPAIPSSDADLVASTQVQIRIRDDMNAAADMANRLEVARKQVEDLLKANRGKDELEKPLLDLDKKLMDVELQVITRSDMMSDDKYYPEQYRVYMNLIWLNGVVNNGAGDVAGGAEYRPTTASVQVLDLIEKDLATAKAGFTTAVDKDLAAFNAAMAGKLPPIKDK
jgi:hypothetical protein